MLILESATRKKPLTFGLSVRRVYKVIFDTAILAKAKGKPISLNVVLSKQLALDRFTLYLRVKPQLAHLNL